MHSVSEVIVVEGRYDKNTLSQIIDATIIETSGFGVFNDREKQQLLRTLAQKRGLIIFTDPDGAGLVIRNFIKGCVDPKLVKNAYIPEIEGKERRKARSSREGKLGVEGMSDEVIMRALRQAGATIDGQNRQQGEKITIADMYAKGLTGAAGSAAKRTAFLKKAGLPHKMTAQALLQVINALMSREEFLSGEY